MARNPADQVHTPGTAPSRILRLIDPDGTPDYDLIFRQFVEDNDRGVLLLDTRRRVLEINDAARDLLAFSGQPPCSIGDVIRDVNANFAVGEAIHDRKVVQQECFIPEPERILRFNIIPIISGEGRAVHVLMTVDDVTSLRHLETVRRDFVANVSHELRTPIASINLLVETIQSAGDVSPADQAHFLRRIQVETEAMNHLVEELLQLSKLESGRLSLNLEPIELDELIGTVTERLAVMAEEKGVDLRAHVQRSLPPALADPQALLQVFMNLVHNAIKFTPAGGQVSVRARRHGPSIEIEVSDTGVGLAAGDAARVFERFYKVDKGRTRETGTGLGLAIARHVLDLHGSQLAVISEPGHGARFTFALAAVD